MRIPDHTGDPDPRVEMLPLIDIVFLVLVAFIYASMFLTQNVGLPVSLPESSQAKPQPSDVITLTIKKNGSLYLDEQPLSLDALVAALHDARMYRPNAVLLVKADREASIGRLVKVMDRTRMAGIDSLTIQAKTETTAVAEK